MLHLYYEEIGVYSGPLTESNYRISPALWFDNQGGARYIAGSLEKQIIKDIDESEVISDQVLLHPRYGAFSPNNLSGTTKTLILINNEPQFYYNGAFLGENACKWLQLIADSKDVYLRMAYVMPFMGDFKIHFVNTDDYTYTQQEYLRKSLSLV